MAAYVGEKELEAVGGTGDRDGRGGLGLNLGSGLDRLLLFVLWSLGSWCWERGLDRLADLEAGALELARQLLDLFVIELQLGREGFELGGFDEATLLRTLDDRADLV